MNLVLKCNYLKILSKVNFLRKTCVEFYDEYVIPNSKPSISIVTINIPLLPYVACKIHKFHVPVPCQGLGHRFVLCIMFSYMYIFDNIQERAALFYACRIWGDIELFTSSGIRLLLKALKRPPDFLITLFFSCLDCNLFAFNPYFIIFIVCT